MAISILIGFLSLSVTKNSLSELPILGKHRTAIYFTPYDLARQTLAKCIRAGAFDPKDVAGFLVIDDRKASMDWSSAAATATPFGSLCPDERDKEVLAVPYAASSKGRMRTLFVYPGGPPVQTAAIYLPKYPSIERIQVTLPVHQLGTSPP